MPQPTDDEIREALWTMNLSELCALIGCRIVKENRTIRSSNRGFRVMIEHCSAFLSHSEALADANEDRDLADRVEHRVLQPVKAIADD